MELLELARLVVLREEAAAGQVEHHQIACMLMLQVRRVVQQKERHTRHVERRKERSHGWLVGSAQRAL
eukprot:6549978-Prymnesium_polylepis.1